MGSFQSDPRSFRHMVWDGVIFAKKYKNNIMDKEISFIAFEKHDFISLINIIKSDRIGTKNE